MNPAPRPSKKFWIWGVLLLFLIHGAAVFWFGKRSATEPTWQKPEPFLYAGDAEVDLRLAEVIAYRDPTLFALPHPHGFSGGAWSGFQPEVLKLSNWSASPEWLVLSVDQLGDSLHDFVATNQPSVEPLLAALRATKTLETRLPGEPVLTRTAIRVEGPLAARALLGTPPLPAMPHTDVPRPTTVAVSVNGEGVVESASVAVESGLKLADTNAVELARQFEFAPLALRGARARVAATPTLGQIIFTWQVVRPTNVVTAGGNAR